MAKSKRKASNAQPITAHPLFPAVVALWFGALFGLGSLAVRPSLLEAAVIASRIDLLIPAAAPPLGVTARILVALGLSAVGSALGLMIARRITRPKVEVRQRKRTGVAREEAELQYRARDAHPDAPARRPISAHDELNTEDSPNGGVLAGRRRALAVELPEEAFVPHDMAPLPGATPQIFEIGDLELGAGMADSSPQFAPRDEPAPLDLGSFAQPVEAESAVPVQSVALDWSAAPAAAAFSAPMDLPAAMQAPDTRQQFQPPVADSAPPADLAPPRQIFGMTATDDHLPQEFVQAAGFKTSVFEVEEAEPLFPSRAPQSPAPLDFSRPTSLAESAEPVAQLAAEPEPVAATPVVPTPAAPVAEPLPPLSTLGMTDLAARLAESMLRRRAARAEQAAPVVAAPEPAPLIAEPAPYTPFAQYAPSEPVPAPFAKTAPVAELIAVEAAVVAAAVEPAAPAAPVAMPRFTVSEPAPQLVDVPPAPLAMPAALRPLTLDEPLAEDEDDVLASLLPPRHLSMPAPEPEVAEVTPTAETVDPEVVAEDEALGAEDKCGSLLDLGLSALARPQFVRIEEPEADAAAFEPVVIFPGQAPLGVAAAAPFAGAAAGSYAPAAPAFSPSPAPFAAPADSAPFRQFDAPSSLGAGQPVVNPGAAAALDPAETERALRAALSNLQRMSGAA